MATSRPATANRACLISRYHTYHHRHNDHCHLDHHHDHRDRRDYLDHLGNKSRLELECTATLQAKKNVKAKKIKARSGSFLSYRGDEVAQATTCLIILMIINNDDDDDAYGDGDDYSEVAQATTSGKLGLRVCGFQRYSQTDGAFQKVTTTNPQSS